MKLLSDFDGVLTDLTAEARRVRELFDAELASARPGCEAETRATVEAAERACDAEPHRHGWTWEGRVTAFVDEDLFVRVNGIAARLDEEADRGAGGPAALRAAVQARGRKHFRDVAQAAYVAMTVETAAGKIHPVDAATPQVLGELVRRGVEIVVVSNSGTERILRLLRDAGLDARPHDGAPHPLRVRGDAKKFVLGDDPARRRSFRAGAYDVQTDRPHYEAILREERPDFVLGDVFSLDLALPIALRRGGEPGFAGLHALLRRRPYTPAWPGAWLLGEPSVRWSPVDDLTRLLDVIR
jgi:FMN phosphatase YigB (HAD superfamily)